MTHVRSWPAPAKLNLFLHITGRRDDGYHDLQTVFQLIDLCDTIDIELRDDGRVERGSGAAGVPAEQDLVVRAALALQEAAAARGRVPVLGATLNVTKRIPMGGGLGGGSSDAATVLLALNRLWECGLSVDDLAGIGVRLGADVPVFVRGRSAWAEGRGERLTPLDLPERWYAIIHPQVHVPTAALFQAPELTRNTPPLRIPALPQSGDRNDFEPVARTRYPEVGRALDWLDGQGVPARLTGTGSCIFAPCAGREQAELIAGRVPPEWRGFAVRGLNTSPVRALLDG